MISSAWGRVPARKARREATGLDLNQETPPDEQHELATILPIPHSFYSPSSQGLTSPVTEWMSFTYFGCGKQQNVVWLVHHPSEVSRHYCSYVPTHMLPWLFFQLKTSPLLQKRSGLFNQWFLVLRDILLWRTHGEHLRQAGGYRWSSQGQLPTPLPQAALSIPESLSGMQNGRLHS